jgi:hypothetical protein
VVSSQELDGFGRDLHVFVTSAGQSRSWMVSEINQQACETGRVPFRLRVRVGLHRGRLDLDIATGIDPRCTEDHALRARQLSSAGMRRVVARSLRRAAVAGRQPVPTRLGGAVEVSRPAGHGWGEGLLGLADLLTREEPVNPLGVARALVMLSDGAGPLYRETPGSPLVELIWWVADGLHGCAPHEWVSPEVMKLDPERAEWTCARCGAVETSDDPASRPN